MRFTVIAALVGLLFTSSAQAALPSCASDSERSAMLVRGLQSYLMMAGVACNQGDAYNKFVTANQRELSAQGMALKSYFQRVYGGSAERQMNDFITEIANAWSQVHMRDMATYCKSTWEMMWQLEKQPVALTELSKGIAAQPGVTAVMCSGVSAGAGTRVATAQPPAATPAR